LPRAFWDWKNHYCWNSNLDERTFLRLLQLYCHGVTCSKATTTIKEEAGKRGFKPISRQSVNRYYLLFGDYLFAMLPEAYRFTEIELALADGLPEGMEFPDGYVQQLVAVAMHNVLYDRLDHNDPINKALIGNTTQETHDMMARQSKAMRGIPLETFWVHLAFNFWHSIMKEEQPKTDPGKALFKLMKQTLKQHPIGSFELRSTRLVRNK